MKTAQLNTKGFSLVEVVVSIAIIGIVFTALFSLFSMSSKTTHVSGEKTDLAVIAQNVMEHSLYQEGFAALKNSADGTARDISSLIPADYHGQYSAVRIISYVESSDNKLIKIVIRTRDNSNPESGSQVSLVTLLADV